MQRSAPGWRDGNRTKTSWNLCSISPVYLVFFVDHVSTQLDFLWKLRAARTERSSRLHVRDETEITDQEFLLESDGISSIKEENPPRRDDGLQIYFRDKSTLLDCCLSEELQVVHHWRTKLVKYWNIPQIPCGVRWVITQTTEQKDSQFTDI